MYIRVTEKDFEKLTESSAQWGDWARDKRDRWEHAEEKYDTEPSWGWQYAYWVGDDWTKVMLCRTFLESLNPACQHDYEVLWDMAEHPNGEFLGYVILTNYASPGWQEFEKMAEENN